MAQYKNTAERRKAEGKCTHCEKPAAKGRVRCIDCSIRESEWRKEKRKSRIREGICTTCGKHSSIENQTECEPCIQSKMEKRKTERISRICTECHKPNSHPFFVVCDSCREVSSQYIRKHSQKFTKNGKCRKCQSDLNKRGRVHCDNCLSARKSKYQDMVQRGLCPGCGQLNTNAERSYCQECSSKIVAKTKKRVTDRKQKVMNAYGGKCVCCGESSLVYLNIDHVNNDGCIERQYGLKGDAMYRHIEKNNYPENYQVLCFNCNFAKHYQGFCSHEKNDDTNKTVLDDSFHHRDNIYFTDPIAFSGCGPTRWQSCNS